MGSFNLNGNAKAEITGGGYGGGAGVVGGQDPLAALAIYLGELRTRQAAPPGYREPGIDKQIGPVEQLFAKLVPNHGPFAGAHSAPSPTNSRSSGSLFNYNDKVREQQMKEQAYADMQAQRQEQRAQAALGLQAQRQQLGEARDRQGLRNNILNPDMIRGILSKLMQGF